jgi:hypothetical protein
MNQRDEESRVGYGAVWDEFYRVVLDPRVYEVRSNSNPEPRKIVFRRRE